MSWIIKTIYANFDKLIYKFNENKHYNYLKTHNWHHDNKIKFSHKQDFISRYYTCKKCKSKLIFSHYHKKGVWNKMSCVYYISINYYNAINKKRIKNKLNNCNYEMMQKACS